MQSDEAAQNQLALRDQGPDDLWTSYDEPTVGRDGLVHHMLLVPARSKWPRVCPFCDPGQRRQHQHTHKAPAGEADVVVRHPLCLPPKTSARPPVVRLTIPLHKTAIGGDVTLLRCTVCTLRLFILTSPSI